MSIKENLKKVVPNKEIRLKLNRALTKNISDETMIKFLYRISTGEKLNLDNPVTFNEKIQWYKLNYRDPLMTKCSDKFLVREFVKEKGLGNILTPLYGVYESVDEINFKKIPSECFIKCTHNSNGNVLWRKSKLDDVREIKKRIEKMMNNNAFYSSREWAYKDIKPRVICEELLESNNKQGLVDFNFFCFNGEPKFLMYNIGLSDENGEHAIGKRAVLDMNFKELDMKTSLEKLDMKDVKKPDNFEEMVDYAKILSAPFPFVRVDFFHVNNEIRFGELTFYTGGGVGIYEPRKWQEQLGEWMELPPKLLSQ